MNATEVKTRHGLILQGAIGQALRSVGLTFRENWQYDPDSERPDFTIPAGDEPDFAVEVHQTDARNAFQMKTLRSFNAVTEAKLFFGDRIVSVNILFGNPDTEIPHSNARALYGFFDVNLVPRNEAPDREAVERLESFSLQLAADEDYNVAGAIELVLERQASSIESLASLVENKLKNAQPKTRLLPLWRAERRRVQGLGDAPDVGPPIHTKRAILQSLFLSDEHFAQLVKIQDPNKCSADLREQLSLTKLAETRPSIRGDVLSLVPIFRQFLTDPEAPRLRKLCEQRLEEASEMHWFFEDIRDTDRRKCMAQTYLAIIREGPTQPGDAISQNIRSDNVREIQHRRCWTADLTALYLGVSHNEMNRRLVAMNCDPQQLGNPFNQLCYKSQRFMTGTSTHATYVEGVARVFEVLVSERTNEPIPTADDLASRLAKFRTDAAVKLQKLNPLYLAVESVARELGLDIAYRGTPSFLSDLSGATDPVGKYDLYALSDGQREVLVNALYIGEGYGSDHKADEWSARRRSMGYRLGDEEVNTSDRAGYLFVVDGAWLDKSIRKLHNAGWDYICRLPDLEHTLEEIFAK